MEGKDRLDWYRLLAKTDYNGDEEACWNWTATFFRGKALPYGQCWFRGTTWSAHRAMWVVANGPIPVKAHILHKCNNSKCINPKHLYPGDAYQNMRDRDECGHTSRGAHRYNYKRNEELVQKVVTLRQGGMEYKKIAAELGIGRSTVLRCLGKMD